MKKIAFTLILLIAISAQSQRKGSHQNRDLTPEQRAIMRTKQMTLRLDLTDQQQSNILVLNQEMAQDFGDVKEQMNSLPKEERFNLKNEMLDKKIAFQRNLKTILTTEQYETWKKHANKRMQQMKEKRRQSAE